MCHKSAEKVRAYCDDIRRPIEPDDLPNALKPFTREVNEGVPHEQESRDVHPESVCGVLR